jgi:hypothetical protein
LMHSYSNELESKISNPNISSKPIKSSFYGDLLDNGQIA